MTSLAAFYPSCAALGDPHLRNRCAGAAYRVADAVRLGESYASAESRMLSLAFYSDALAAASLTAAFSGIDAP